jgi:hypothetical protein
MEPTVTHPVVPLGIENEIALVGLAGVQNDLVSKSDFVKRSLHLGRSVNRNSARDRRAACHIHREFQRGRSVTADDGIENSKQAGAECLNIISNQFIRAFCYCLSTPERVLVRLVMRNFKRIWKYFRPLIAEVFPLSPRGSYHNSVYCRCVEYDARYTQLVNHSSTTRSSGYWIWTNRNAFG